LIWVNDAVATSLDNAVDLETGHETGRLEFAMTAASTRSLAAAALLGIALCAPAFAQPGGWGSGMMMGPGMMTRGPGMWGPGYGGMCNPRFAGLAEWRIDEIERAVKPTDAQQAALKELRTASTKAAESLAAACPSDWPKTASERLSFMEKRTEAMLAAVKAVRPAFDAFYQTLDETQKSRLDAAGPRRWGWQHWRDRY